MRKKSSLLIALCLFVLLLSSKQALSETTIRADNLKHDKKNDLYHLWGNVVIVRDDQTVRAQKIDYYRAEDEVRAEGDVYYEDPDLIIHARRAEINIKNKTGTLYDPQVFFKRDEYRIKASRIERLGKQEYLLYDARATTCEGTLPAWCFSSERARLITDESLRAKNVAFRIKGLPVLYSPYIIVPVQRERKSGLLFPTIGFNSTNGLLWRQPLYLVLSENRDATLYLDYQGRKGLGQALEYRYIERYAGEGNLWLYHIRDRQAHRDYFELKAEHRRSGASGLTGFLKLNLINRKDFYSTFSHRVEAWSSRFLQSTAQIALNKRTYQLYIDGRFWQELRQGHQTGEIHQQLPEIGLYYYPERHNPLYISTQVSLVNYHSVELSRIRRLDIYPVFRHSLGKTFRFSQSLGLRGTFYWISNTDQYPDTEQRASFDYNVSLKTLFRREFGRYTHIVEPELFYSFIPETVDDIPSVDGVDSYDRLSLLGLSINNYLYRGPQMLASMRITEPYDFHGGDRPLRPVRLQLRLFEPLDLTSEFSYNTEDGRIDRANITVSKTIRDFSISLSQRYSRDYDILFYNGSVTVPVTRKLNLSGSVWYDAKGEGMKNYRVALSYQSQCWGIKVTYDKRPGDYSLYVLLQFKGLGELKLESFI